MRTTTSFVAAAALFVGLGPDLAHSNSISIIDQQQTGYEATIGFMLGVTDLVQTFTIGISGELDSISLIAAAGAGLPITLNLLQTSGGLPTSTVIASAVATPGYSNPIWTTFDFTNVMVTVGEVLAFQPIATSSNGQVVALDLAYGDEPDPYSRGELSIKVPQSGGNWEPFNVIAAGQNLNYADMTFITTVSPVPLPAALPLFASGLGVIAWMARRKKRASSTMHAA